ncbi:restriction endonuclease subunit S [Lysobacter soli]|uniref:restriction endonuclease subunit S n=1 Tax=Lysobacter soli TaxID=453783 RepID=UPI00209D9B91|nr:restriction endonuclease subunit S [Lysobacter soli]UTA55188.1 restriction endonuclease subunit S [Lysobacter soli]
MELSPAHKTTAIGAIPEEWDVKPMSAVLAKARLGGNYPNQLAETDFPLMKMGNIARGVFDVSTFEYISPRTIPEAQHRLSCGDVLFNTRNTLDLVGKVAIWRDELPTAYYNSNLLRLEFKPSEIASSVFANYWLNTAAAVSRLRALATGTTSVAAIYTRDLLRFDVAVPPPHEQTAIATVLSDVDSLLVEQDALIVKKRAMRQGAMQELLTGKLRLPGFSGEWNLQRLGDAAVLKARIGWQGLTTAEYLDSGDYYLVTGTDFTSGKIDWANCHYVTKYRYDQDPYIQIAPRDVLVTKDGTIGKVAIVDAVDKPGTLNSGVFVIRPKSKSFVPEFFYYLLLSDVFDKFLSQLSAGSTINHLYQKDFVGFTYRLPPTEEEQVAIAEVLRDMDTDIDVLEAKREKTALLKHGMMQELLTGRIRLV